MAERYWETKALSDMTKQEWEQLCDGCGKCCLHKLEDADSGDVYYTRVACRLLDIDTCRCSNYPQRQALVPDCLSLTPDGVSQFDWLPGSCAYRKLARGEALEWWHPLVSGRPETVHEAGVSVRDVAVPEHTVDAVDFEDFVIGQPHPDVG